MLRVVAPGPAPVGRDAVRNHPGRGGLHGADAAGRTLNSVRPRSPDAVGAGDLHGAYQQRARRQAGDQARPGVGGRGRGARPAAHHGGGRTRIVALGRKSRTTAPDKLRIQIGGCFSAVAGPVAAIGVGGHGMDSAALAGDNVYGRNISTVDFTTHILR